jgi:hypothetical protein
MVAFNMGTNAASHRIFLVGNGEAESEKPPGRMAFAVNCRRGYRFRSPSGIVTQPPS